MKYDSFTALNQRGYLKVQVDNMGYIAAAYSVQVLLLSLWAPACV